MKNIGEILDGRYEVVGYLGEGGMGRVYLCRNTRLDTLVAVKEFKKEDSISLISEPHILKKLKHKGIPYIYDIFQENNFAYMVEEYIKGQTLDEYIKGKTLDLERMISIAVELCDIIGYLHGFSPSIIYRDLKPSNIIIKSDGSAALIDFGISRVYKENNLEDTIYMGSMGYAAPEQCGKGQSCKQTDVYGLGAVIFFMMNKRAPSNFLEPLNFDAYNKSYGDILPRIVIRAMALDVNKRFPTMDEMKQQLLRARTVDRTRLILQSEKSAAPVFAANTSKADRKSAVGRGKKLAILMGLALVIVVVGLAAGSLNKTSVEERVMARISTSGADSKAVKDEDISNTLVEPISMVEDISFKAQQELQNIEDAEDEEDDKNEEQVSDNKEKSGKGKGNKKKK